MRQGKRVRLRSPERTDIPAFIRWFNDPEVTEFLLRSPPLGVYEEERWFDSLLQREGKVICIETNEGKLIGNIGILHIDWLSRKAEIGMAIGEKDYWSKGFGTEALSLYLDYLFLETPLNRIWLYCDNANQRARRCYLKCGFKVEGELRAHHFKNGRYIDDIGLSLTRSDWQELRGKK